MSDTALNIPPRDVPRPISNGVCRWRAQIDSLTVTAAGVERIVRVTKDGDAVAEYRLDQASARHLANLLIGEPA
jgi:hypothetical protein